MQILISDIIKALGDDIKKESVITDPTHEVETLLYDSRNFSNRSKSLFFAIKSRGGNDGHKFLKDLYDQGVRDFVVEIFPKELEDKSGLNVIVVEDSIISLGKIGSLRRSKSGEMVAITGSRGKTTLKEWIFQLIEPLKTVSRSPRSFNSRIGVPLSLWETSDTSEISLIEAGVSKQGEMKYLSDLIQPDTVIFTNIGDAHSEGFDSMEEKALEKALLSSGKNVSRIIYCKDDPLLTKAIEKARGKEIEKIPAEHNFKELAWSAKDFDAELFIDYSQSTEGRLNYRWKGEWHFIESQEIKKSYDIENACNALAFMLIQGFEPSLIRERFLHLKRIGTRLNVAEGINGSSVIFDSYTSDSESLRQALDFMLRRKTPKQGTTVVMGDIHHEGQNLINEYRTISEEIRQSGVNKFIGIGSAMKKFGQLFPKNSEFYPSEECLLNSGFTNKISDSILLIKGSPDFPLKKLKDSLEARTHETVLEVNLDSIISNYNYFRSLVPSSTGIIAMVKAFGYGAGSYELAKTLQDCGAAYLAVAVLDEGISLREQGIKMPIMVMNPRSASYSLMFRHHLEPSIYSLDLLTKIIHDAESQGVKDYPVHLKLDTGMHRMGFRANEIETLCKVICATEAIKISSVFSHLATADCLDMDDYTMGQFELFEKMSGEISACFNYHINRHILNSAGIIRFPSKHYDMVRLGIGLYGAETLPLDIERRLAVVSTLRTVIIAIREIKAGETIGYSRKGVAIRPSRIATLPLGYADGINRRLGNGNLKVIVNGHPASTIGNICMDACMIDVTDIDCKVGDPVEIFGNDNPLSAIAESLETIPYEVLTSVSPRVKRVYYRD